MSAALDPLFARLIAIGDSIVQGTQNVGVSLRSQPYGVATLLARQVGAEVRLPLLAEPGYPPHVDDLVTLLRSRLTNPELMRGERLDPELEPTNLAVAGARLEDVVGLTGANLASSGRTRAVQRLTRLVLNPLERPEWEPLSQLDRAIAAAPSLVLLWAGTNNVVETLYYPEQTVTTPANFARLWRLALRRLLDETSAAVVVVTLPDVTTVPLLQVWARHRRLIQRIAQTLEAYNAIILASGAMSPRILAVDLRHDVRRVVRDGEPVAGWDLPFRVAQGKLTFEPLRGRRGTLWTGGLVSYDGMHPTATGYAVLANLIGAQMSPHFGIAIPPIDLAAVAREDTMLQRADPWRWALLRWYLETAYGPGVAELERRAWPVRANGSQP